MSTREQVATVAMGHLLTYVHSLDDINEAGRAGRFVQETYVDSSKPLQAEMTYAEFLAAYRQWKARQQ